MSIVGRCFFDGSWASGMIASAFFATHWCAPAGLLLSSYSYSKRCLKKSWPHCAGVVVHVTSRPLVIASAPLPVPYVFAQPKPCASSGAASGSAPTFSAGPAPCALPKVWPPAMRATVSSSFIAMRRNVSRMSRAAATGSGLPLGPSGLT